MPKILLSLKKSKVFLRYRLYQWWEVEVMRKTPNEGVVFFFFFFFFFFICFLFSHAPDNCGIGLDLETGPMVIIVQVGFQTFNLCAAFRNVQLVYGSFEIMNDIIVRCLFLFLYCIFHLDLVIGVSTLLWLFNSL
jgi:hypothetical protein